MKLPLRSSLLSLASPKRLKVVGLWMIILGLVGDAAVIVFVPSGAGEKILSVICTLVIALGVWVEEVGADAVEAKEKAENDLKLAELKTRASEAERETERLRSQFGWRRLSPEAAKTLASVLRGPAGKVSFICVSGDAESQSFVQQLKRAFHMAGWQSSVISGSYAHVVFGVRAPVSTEIGGDAWSKVIRAAFTAAKVEFDDLPISRWGMATGTWGEAGAAEVYIGPKPMPWADSGDTPNQC